MEGKKKEKKVLQDFYFSYTNTDPRSKKVPIEIWEV